MTSYHQDDLVPAANSVQFSLRQHYTNILMLHLCVGRVANLKHANLLNLADLIETSLVPGLDC